MILLPLFRFSNLSCWLRQMCLPFRKWILTVVGTKWDTHHGFFWRLLGKCIISSVDCYVERSEIWKQWLRKEAVRIWVSLGKGWFRLDENNDSHCLIVRSFWSIPTKSLRIREFSTMRKTLALHVYMAPLLDLTVKKLLSWYFPLQQKKRLSMKGHKNPIYGFFQTNHL